jgi:hypothetical protein
MIGKPKRVFVVEPIESPVPAERAPQPDPAAVERPEPVLAPEPKER